MTQIRETKIWVDVNAARKQAASIYLLTSAIRGNTVIIGLYPLGGLKLSFLQSKSASAVVYITLTSCLIDENM